MTPLDVITIWLTPLSGKDLIEIGCGTGALRSSLEAQGASWTGVDPAAEDAPPFVCAGAEKMPLADEQFDAAICVNALHHVPVALMAQALNETRRVLRPQGRLVVIEPQPHGDLSQVLAVIDDEAEIRTAAQAALDQATAQGLFVEPERFVYNRTEVYSDFARFCEVIRQVDPARDPLIATHHDQLQARFLQLSQHVYGGFALGQPMSARLFERR